MNKRNNPEMPNRNSLSEVAPHDDLGIPFEQHLEEVGHLESMYNAPNVTHSGEASSVNNNESGNTDVGINEKVLEPMTPKKLDESKLTINGIGKTFREWKLRRVSRSIDRKAEKAKEEREKDRIDNKPIIEISDD